MKRFIVLTLILVVGAGLGVGAFYVATNWNQLNPFRTPDPEGHTSVTLITHLRQTCVNDKELRGASIQSIETTNNKLILRGWIGEPKQKDKLEKLAQALLDESPKLARLCPDGVSSTFTVFPIDQHLMQLQHDFDEGKGAEKDDDALKRSVMRTTRLDRMDFTEDAKLRVEAVCIRGGNKRDLSTEVLKAALKSRLEASGLRQDQIPDLVLEVRYFTSPALLLQKELARVEGMKDVRITTAWYDGEGKLRIEGLVTKDEQRDIVSKTFAPIARDANHVAMFVRPGAAEAKFTINLVTLDDAVIVGKLQRRLIEAARKENKPHLRRVRLVSVRAAAEVNEKSGAVTDDEGNPFYGFRVTGRVLENANDFVRTRREIDSWLAQELPNVRNPDQMLLPLYLDMPARADLQSALQQRLIDRGLDGAVISDALYDEEGKLELIGRLHQTGDESKQAVDAALKDMLAEEMPWTTNPLKAHETRKDGQPIAWKDVIRATQAKLAGAEAGKRLRLDRLYYRYENEQLRLVADGAFISDTDKDDPAKALTAAVDAVIATRGAAGISLSGLKTLKNPAPELQNLAAERMDLDGVLLTQARYDADGVLRLDGYFGRREQKPLLAGLVGDRLGKIPQLVKPGAAPGWSLDALKPYASQKGESTWSDVVRGCQSELASNAALRRASIERMHFHYADAKSQKATLVWKATCLTRPGEKLDEPALTERVADTCKTLLPELPAYAVYAALTKVGTPIYALQELAVKHKHDGMLFHDAYFDRDGKLVLEGKRGSDEQLKDVKTLLDQVLAGSKTPLAPAGVAPLDRMVLVPWQPLLLDIRTQFAQGDAFHKRTRIDRVFFQYDDATKKTNIHVEGICIYQGTKLTQEEQSGVWLWILEKQLAAKGIENLAIHLRGIERKPDPAPEMLKRANEAGADGVVFDIGFDAKGVCYIQAASIPAGFEATIRKLLEEYSSKRKDDLGTLQLR